MQNEGASTPPDLRSFGRRRGRAPSARQASLLHDALPPIRVALDRLGSTPAELRKNLGVRPESAVWLEVGFGGGEHLAWQAMQNLQVCFIGCEPFEDGVVKLLSAIETDGLSNIRLHPDDARDLLRRLPPASIDRAFVLFPDPWPKRKHHKRRLLSGGTLALLADAMKSGAELRIATDIPDYARTIMMALRTEARFRWTAERPSDWTQRPADAIETRYEAKARAAGRRCVYLSFRRV